jgi:hypothetical protein
MNNFLKILKIKAVLSVYALTIVQLFCYRVMEKKKMKFWLPSLKTLIKFENPSSNPLQIACCGIQEAACDSFNCSVIGVLRYYFSKYQADY